MVKKIKSWSYSTLGVYEKCAKRSFFAKIAKIPTPSSPVLEKGKAVHAKGEQYLRGNIPNVPKEYKVFEKEMRNLRKYGASPEHQHCLTKDWVTTAWTDWTFGWLRFITDAEVHFEDGVSVAVDFKTGKIYETHEEQASVIATGLMAENETVEYVYVEFWYLDQDQINVFEYDRKDLTKMKRKWTNRSKPMLNDTVFLPSPSPGNCKWCDFKDVCDEAIQ